jgi:hypothetical protein
MPVVLRDRVGLLSALDIVATLAHGCVGPLQLGLGERLEVPRALAVRDPARVVARPVVLVLLGFGPVLPSSALVASVLLGSVDGSVAMALAKCLFDT